MNATVRPSVRQTETSLPETSLLLEAAPPVITTATVAAALGAILLIVPEIWVAGGGLVWALTGLLHLGKAAVAILAGIVAVPVLWASWHVVRWAFQAETDPENARY